MDNYKIIECISSKEVQETYPVMKQLHTHLADNYVELVAYMQKHKGYKLFRCVDDQGSLVALVSYTIEMRLSANGKLMYLEDLVIDEQYRGQGLGTKLLDFACEHAKQAGCTALTLDCGIQRLESHEFYKKRGLKNDGLNFKINL